MAPIDWMSDTRTPQQSISFVLLPGILAQSKEYLARFTAITPTGLPIFNKLLLDAKLFLVFLGLNLRFRYFRYVCF